MYKFCLFVLLILSENAVAACSEADKNLNQSNMNLCSYEDYKHADAKLNVMYKKLMTTLSKEDAEKLKRFQQNWVKEANKHCEAEGDDYQGGSMQPLIINNCLWFTTEKRNSELELQLAVNDAIAYLTERDSNPYGDRYPNRKTTSTNFKGEFLTAQKYWEKYREYECRAYKATFYHHDENGDYFIDCLKNLNDARVKLIKETYLKK